MSAILGYTFIDVYLKMHKIGLDRPSKVNSIK